MRRTILNEPNISKALRLVLFLITMLLLPSAAWGQAYGLTVAGTVVTSENAKDIFNDGKVSFRPADGTIPASLMLDNAQIVSANGIVWTGDGNLTIVLSGNNSINCGTGSNVGEGVCIQGNNSQGNLTFVKGSETEKCKLTLSSSQTPIFGFNNSNYVSSGLVYDLET
jgi:hypothetical protein